MISDPYAQMQHIFGQEVKGLLGAREFYSKYWNDLNVDKVSAIRSPCTHSVEVNNLDLKKSNEMNYWYKYLSSGVVYNVFDDSVMLHSGSDKNKINVPLFSDEH
jgi:hypothetical protein